MFEFNVNLLNIWQFDMSGCHLLMRFWFFVRLFFRCFFSPSDWNLSLSVSLRFVYLIRQTILTCAEPFSAKIRSWTLNRFRVNSSTLMVLASVSRRNSVSWATQCISSLRMGCKWTAFSNSRRGNSVGNKMNGAN